MIADSLSTVAILDIEEKYKERLKFCVNDFATLGICMSDTMPNSEKLLEFLVSEIVDILGEVVGVEDA